MANRTDIENKVRNLIHLQLGVAQANLDLSKDLCDSHGADSLDLIELVMLAEDDFGIEIPDTCCMNIKTGKDLVTAICNEAKIP